MTKKIIILTGNEIRHQYFKKKVSLDKRFEVVYTFCEAAENIIEKGAQEVSVDKRTQHLLARQQSEVDFFEEFIKNTEDKSNSIFIEKGDVNKEKNIQQIVTQNPDLIIVYGASVLQDQLLSIFTRRILNVHLGLSPYYRGAATNFWPLVDMLPECVGATFMYIDAGIDTGEIIHQIRPQYQFYDTPSIIGNRLIKDMTSVYCSLIHNIDHIGSTELPQFNHCRKLCKKKDFNEASVEKLYTNFNEGMIKSYLMDKERRDSLFPVVQNKVLQ